MATAALVSGETLTDQPFIVRKLTVTSGTTAAALAHGGPAVVPDIVFGVNTAANPTGSNYSMTASSTTTITPDFEEDSKTWTFYCIFFATAAGGIS